MNNEEKQIVREKKAIPFRENDPDFGGCWVYHIKNEHGHLKVSCHTYYSRYNKIARWVWFNIKVFFYELFHDTNGLK